MNAHREIDEPSVVDIRALNMDFQAPECLNEEDVQRYGADLENGVPFEPIIVCFDGVSLFLKDGFHRVEAARRRGLTELSAEIMQGTLEQMEEENRSMWDGAIANLRRETSVTPRPLPHMRCATAQPDGTERYDVVDLG